MPERITFPAWGARGGPRTELVGEFTPARRRCCATSELARVWELSQELKEGTDDAVRVRRARSRPTSTTASRTRSGRRPAAASLDGFLFDAKIGFCQQFSGAEALLLRMAGIPARVATGFTTGSFDEKQQEYVVRDLDAHSVGRGLVPRHRLGDARPDAGHGAAARAAGRRRGGAGVRRLARRAGPRR